MKTLNYFNLCFEMNLLSGDKCTVWNPR